MDAHALTCDNCHAWVTPAGRIRSRRTGTGSQPTGDVASQAHLETKVVSLDVERERPTRLVEVHVPAVVKRMARHKARAARKGNVAADALEDDEPLLDFLQQHWSTYFKGMHPTDRRTFWALTVAALGVFLPWAHVVGRGLVSGVEGFGLVALGAAAVGLVSLHLRMARRRWRGALMAVQVIATGAVIGIPGYLLIAGAIGRGHIGVAVTVIGGLAALLLSLWRMPRL